MVIILMGVTGSGKTTVGRLLSQELGWKFYDADDFHPPANIGKMKQGIPLGDDDRIPWLEKLRDLVRTCLERDENAVLACSALKEAYREYLLINTQVTLVYLRGDPDLLRERLQQRRGHFMDPKLLDSQFADLEEPQQAVVIDVSPSPGVIVQSIRSRLGI
ncbi:MAG: gluconokinase [Candidatus Binatia bacterium]